MVDRAQSFTGYAVAVVGGGGGLGRQYSLDLARAGAQVLVAGRSDSAAAVADEIRGTGGLSAHCIADACEGETIINATLAAFGRIDGLIVNAGIVRDRTFAKMTADDWNAVLAVHLQGAFACAKAAWGPMLTQRHGRILLTTSGAGFHGNFGQANYATAKAGIIGLMRSLAIEGKAKGILVNAIAPMAATAMTQDVFPAKLSKALRPEAVAPFALALIHPASELTGEIIEVGGGWAATMRWERSAGVRLPAEALDVDQVLRSLPLITDFTRGSDHPTSTAQCLEAAAGFKPFDQEIRSL